MIPLRNKIDDVLVLGLSCRCTEEQAIMAMKEDNSTVPISPLLDITIRQIIRWIGITCSGSYSWRVVMYGPSPFMYLLSCAAAIKSHKYPHFTVQHEGVSSKLNLTDLVTLHPIVISLALPMLDKLLTMNVDKSTAIMNRLSWISEQISLQFQPVEEDNCWVVLSSVDANCWVNEDTTIMQKFSSLSDITIKLLMTYVVLVNKDIDKVGIKGIDNIRLALEKTKTIESQGQFYDLLSKLSKLPISELQTSKIKPIMGLVPNNLFEWSSSTSRRDEVHVVFEYLIWCHLRGDRFGLNTNKEFEDAFKNDLMMDHPLVSYQMALLHAHIYPEFASLSIGKWIKKHQYAKNRCTHEGGKRRRKGRKVDLTPQIREKFDLAKQWGLGIDVKNKKFEIGKGVL